jgi:hypothetical protein
MKIGQVVEYQTGWGEYGVGRVEKIDEAGEQITVVDEVDGTRWHGPMDRATILPAQFMRHIYAQAGV